MRGRRGLAGRGSWLVGASSSGPVPERPRPVCARPRVPLWSVRPLQLCGLCGLPVCPDARSLPRCQLETAPRILTSLIQPTSEASSAPLEFLSAPQRACSERLEGRKLLLLLPFFFFGGEPILPFGTRVFFFKAETCCRDVFFFLSSTLSSRYQQSFSGCAANNYCESSTKICRREFAGSTVTTNFL